MSYYVLQSKLYYIREILSQGSTERLWNVCETLCYWLSARETQTNRSAVLSHMHHVNIHIIQQESVSIAQFPILQSTGINRRCEAYKVLCI